MNLYQMRTFDFNGKSVQVVDIDGEPWFVAKDLDEVLGYRQTSDMAKKLLKPHEYQRRRVPTSTIRREGENQVTERVYDRWQILISESGLYSLIMRSWKPEVKEFQEWVTSEVLPTIRKTGRYEMEEASFENYSTQQRTIYDEYRKLKTQNEFTINVTANTPDTRLIIGINFSKETPQERIYNIRKLVAVLVDSVQRS